MSDVQTYISTILTDVELIKKEVEVYKKQYGSGQNFGFDDDELFFAIRKTDGSFLGYGYPFASFLEDRLKNKFALLLSELIDKTYQYKCNVLKAIEFSSGNYQVAYLYNIISGEDVEFLINVHKSLISELSDQISLSETKKSNGLGGAKNRESVKLGDSFKIKFAYRKRESDIKYIVNEFADIELLVSKDEVNSFYQLISTDSFKSESPIHILGTAANFKYIWDRFFKLILKNWKYDIIEHSQLFIKPNGTPYKANQISNAKGRHSPSMATEINNIIREFKF